MVAGVWFLAILFNIIPGLETLLSFVLYPLYFLSFCWNCFVALLAEKKRVPKEAKPADSGVLPLTR